MTSLPSPTSARSAMNRKREKLMLAPETTETRFSRFPRRLFCCTHFLAPATPSAPDGSGTARVSSGVALMVLDSDPRRRALGKRT